MKGAAKSYNIRQISPKQQLAIAALVKGDTDEAAAKIAGVHRTTVNDWRNHDPMFIQELNKKLNALHAATMAPFNERMREIARFSLDTILRAVMNGDTTSARWFLDKSDYFGAKASEQVAELISPAETLPEDIETIASQIAQRITKKLFEEEGLTDLEMNSASDLVVKITKDISDAILHDYHGG